jgi:hypothetical protein
MNVSEDEFENEREHFIENVDLIQAIQENLLKFVDEKSLTLCEFLSLNKINRFLQKINLDS